VEKSENADDTGKKEKESDLILQRPPDPRDMIQLQIHPEKT